MDKAVYAIAEGLVQGVGYRYFIQQTAMRLGVTGFVRNLPDGRVEFFAEGNAGLIQELLTEAKRGSYGAHVTGLKVEERAMSFEYGVFVILH